MFTISGAYCLILLITIVTVNANSIPLNPELGTHLFPTTGNATGIFIHISSGTSTQNIANQSDFSFSSVDTNKTLDKREDYPIDQCEDPRAWEFRGSSCIRGLGRRRSWKRTCRWRPTIDDDPQPPREIEEEGLCGRRQYCTDGASTGFYDPATERWDIAACRDSWRPCLLGEFLPSWDRLLGVLPAVLRAFEARITINRAVGFMMATCITAHYFKQNFDRFGIPYNVPLHGSSACQQCSSLRINSLPEGTTGIAVQVVLPNGVTSSHMSFIN